MLALAHREVAQKRNHIRADIDQQHAAEMQVVVDEADDGTCHQPATLDSRKQKCIRVDEFVSRSQLLDEGGDGGPEYPETGSYQRRHCVEFPHFHLACKSQKSNG